MASKVRSWRRAAGVLTDRQPDAPSGPIESLPRPLHQILEEWRAAERVLGAAPPISAEAAGASVRVRELRAEYQRAHEHFERES